MRDTATEVREDESTVLTKNCLTVSCGANVEVLENMEFTSLSALRKNMKEVLNIGEDHTEVLINGKEVGDIEESKVILDGDETVEFKKPSGEKGQS